MVRNGRKLSSDGWHTSLVSRPRLLSLDEHPGALDALTRLAMQDLILQVHAETRFTIGQFGPLLHGPARPHVLEPAG